MAVGCIALGLCESSATSPLSSERLPMQIAVPLLPRRNICGIRAPQNGIFGRQWTVQKKILVTDDAAFMRMLLKGILIPEKFSVIEATNGQEAVEQYAAHKPDLVLMDITMPLMDGLTALKTIKNRFPDARLVMCTAMGQQTTVIQAIREGAKDFIVKPFQPERVLECVRKHAQ